MATKAGSRAPEDRQAREVSIKNETTEFLTLFGKFIAKTVIHEVENSDTVHQDQSEGSVALLGDRATGDEHPLCGEAWN